MATAASLIGALHSRGWTNAAIARAVGRDRSLIAQGAQGKKPLANLVPGLERLVSTGKGPSAALTEHIVAPRRQTASGAPARVRGSAPSTALSRPKVGELRILDNGRPYERVQSTTQARDYLSRLRPDQHVTISYRGKDGQWHTLGKKGGYRVEWLSARLRGPRGGSRTWASVVRGIAANVYGEGEAGEVVSAVELIAA